MIEAVAAAAALPAATVRRAAMVAGGIAASPPPRSTEGAARLRRIRIALFQPLAPMLAQPADDIADALRAFRTAALEWKLDGARVQVHKHGDDVRIYTRTGNDVTAAAPEIVAALRGVPAHDADPRRRGDRAAGRRLALSVPGHDAPLRTHARRRGDAGTLPLSVFFFDCLRHDGEAICRGAGAERFEALPRALPPDSLMPRLVTSDVGGRQAFYDDALAPRARRRDGEVARRAVRARRAQRRVAQGQARHTLDLVVLAAEWGHGRRKGWLSNLHLGARDPATGEFVMLGKTFKGMTDAMLAWQTEELLAREIARDDWTVYVRPELVVEITFNDLQASPRYPGGLALRFARVKGYRPDKRAEDADTMDTVRAIYAAARAGGAGMSGLSIPPLVTHLNDARLDPHRKHHHILISRRRQHLPRPDAKPRTVARTDNHVAFHHTACQDAAVVRADILDCIAGAVDIEHGNLRAIDLDAANTADREILNRGDIDPVRHIKASPIAGVPRPTSALLTTADPTPVRRARRSHRSPKTPHPPPSPERSARPGSQVRSTSCGFRHGLRLRPRRDRRQAPGRRC